MTRTAETRAACVVSVSRAPSRSSLGPLSNTVEARTGATERREAAFASGAHVVSTDYYRPDPDFGTGYEVSLPGGEPGRCNPVTAPETCEREDVVETP